jgi:hypothetical protein
MTVPNNANTFLPICPVIPGALLITNITRTNPMVITYIDTDQNSYIVGQLIRLFVPSDYGMIQANGLTGQIIALGVDTFTVDIDASLFDAFVYPPTGNVQPASLSPAGSRNLQFSNFTNKEPFQSLNNTGN